MPIIKYHVVLSDTERATLKRILSKGASSAKMIMHANVLLAADERSDKKLSGKEIAERFHIHSQTVHTIRMTYGTKGLNAALTRKKRTTPPVMPKITGDVEARIIALSCSTPPEGRSRWTLRLLADTVVGMGIVESISHESIYRVLKKTT